MSFAEEEFSRQIEEQVQRGRGKSKLCLCPGIRNAENSTVWLGCQHETGHNRK